MQITIVITHNMYKNWECIEFRLGSPRVDENHLRTLEIFRRGQLSHTPHSPLLVQEDADQHQHQERQTGQDYDGGHQIVF